MKKGIAGFKLPAVLIGLALAVQGCGRITAPANTTPQQGPRPSKDEMRALGLQHKTAAELYAALREQAKGGRRLAPGSQPDWSGVYTRTPVPGFSFDPDQPPNGLPTAKLTPEYQTRMMQRIENLKNDVEWDPISTCSPPGHPRWLTEPFLREFVVTPDQTWLINEMVNDIRRIYTDGRDHIPAEDRYPLYNGDSIGFWDSDRLVIHTNQLNGGIYQRAQPDFTEQAETVEVWYKADDNTLVADVWVYDPPALVEPWYTRQSYTKLGNTDKNLRIRYWNCAENQNNAVVQTKEGGTEFRSFTFTDPGKTQGEKP